MRTLIVLVWLSGTAAGYTVTTTSGGATAHWPAPTVLVAVARSAESRTLAPVEVRAALEGAARTWSDGLVALTVTDDESAANAVVRFHYSEWPYAQRALAFTQLFAESDSGVIRSAVIDVDERDHPFGTDGEKGDFDLQSVLTHELGHVIGLGHSTDGDATMYAKTAAGDVRQRTLADDDRAGETVVEALMAASPSGGAGCAFAGAKRPVARGSEALLFGLLCVWFRRRSQRGG